MQPWIHPEWGRLSDNRAKPATCLAIDKPAAAVGTGPITGNRIASFNLVEGPNMGAELGIWVIMLVVSFAHVAQAHPTYWARDATSCTEQPALGSRYGRHGAVTADT
jgi:hypothetical protein